jgi:hypothetical protein
VKDLLPDERELIPTATKTGLTGTIPAGYMIDHVIHHVFDAKPRVLFPPKPPNDPSKHESSTANA